MAFENVLIFRIMQGDVLFYLLYLQSIFASLKMLRYQINFVLDEHGRVWTVNLLHAMLLQHTPTYAISKAI